ncbi:tRNA pseudouridine synthase-like 1 [Teleopsis dalmanni]|uniref:tRNA pseudouridine synthase-like 1 n=1 Tax=Teleopsis dalmanni TaxID=139649 RepID=UPI0018CDD8B1|nr:tRNA pseudouridine synthase-like 1 [Teleopsis dalmanni]
MQRFLLNISYIGTNFRGIQKTINRAEEQLVDVKSVQGCIDLALNVLRPANKVETVLSSRTDKGVHALHSTLHVDLQKYGTKTYDPTTITGVLNRTLHKQKLQIRVIKTERVPDTFHCRYNALGRTYLYRIAVLRKKSDGSNCIDNRAFEEFIPIEEIDRCYFIQKYPFDIERCRSVARMFEGMHDFRTFTSTNREDNPSFRHPRFTVRRIEKISIKPGKTLAIGVNTALAQDLYDFWDIEIKGKSFLYKQVRRIVGALVAIGVGRIDEKSIYEMLTIPSKHSWDSRITLAPAYGLYLSKIHYNENDKYIEAPENDKGHELPSGNTTKT